MNKHNLKHRELKDLERHTDYNVISKLIYTGSM